VKLNLQIHVGQIDRNLIKSYQGYLDSPQWSAKKTIILKMWGWRCALCSAGTELDVHHSTYIRLGREFYSDLLPLCRECHELHHEKRGHGDDPLKGYGVNSGSGW